MPAKGSSFEREICRKLSLWWTSGTRDDVFWRSAGSGAMAKSRKRYQNKDTFGQYGDIQAVDPIGAPLLKVCSFELKRGYGKWSPMDIIDAPPPRKGAKEPVKQTLTKFLDQATEDCHNAGAKWPVLIVRRDARQAAIAMPFGMWGRLSCVPWVAFDYNGECYYMHNLDTWLAAVAPETIVAERTQ